MSASRTAKCYMGFVSLVFVSVFILSTEAQAKLFGFEAITANSTIDPGIGEAQLSVDVTDYGSNQVLFTFSNAGPLTSSITDVYIEDGSLLQIYDDPITVGIIDGIINNPSPLLVNFEEGANPAMLPGSENMPVPLVSSDYFFSADSVSPPPLNGVNPGESLGILFDLKPTKTFYDVITAIENGFTAPDPTIMNPDGTIYYEGTTVRVGIHAQAFGDGDSESFIMTPIPASVILGMLGLGVAGLKLRKFA